MEQPGSNSPKLELTVKDVNELLEALEEYHAIYSPLFQRREQREWSLLYWQGLLSNIPSKAIEPMMLYLKGDDANAIRGMQQFISSASYQDDLLLRRHRSEVNETIGHEDGVLIFDPSGFPRQGQMSAGVKNQYCGQLGKNANCQVGVFAGYASSLGYALLSHRLYVPREWLEDEQFAERRKKAGIPEGLEFQTKQQLSIDMLRSILDEGSLQFRWVLFDCEMGMDTKTLDVLEQMEQYYFADVPHDTRVWQERPKTEIPSKKGIRGRTPTREKLLVGEPKAVTVQQLAESLPKEAWSLEVLKEGSKGPIVSEVAMVRVVAARGQLPGPEVWLVIRKNVDDEKVKYHLSNAPEETERKKLTWLLTMRWPIETCFEDGKQLVGMGDYEVRSWKGWHHHMTMCILAHFFLVKMKLKHTEKSPLLTVPQVQLLLVAVLPVKEYDAEWVLEVMGYRQRRNYAAYLSHRKRRRSRYKKHQFKRLKCTESITEIRDEIVEIKEEIAEVSL